MKYLICVTNRVGSTWLCSMLASTGVAGNPAEHFNLPPEGWPRFREHYAAIRKIDPLGIKTAYPALMRAIKEVGRAEFEGVPSVFLQRKDTLAQAISNYRAMVSGQWFRRRDEPISEVRLPLDREAIFRLKAEYERTNQVLWPGWFQSMGIRPLKIWYEQLCEDPTGTVREVCHFLGFPDPAHIDTGQFRVQRDAESQRWHDLLSPP